MTQPPVALPLVAAGEKTPTPLKWAAILVSPHVPWWQFEDGERLVQLWADASSAVPYTDEVGQSVVDTLLQIASWKSGEQRGYCQDGPGTQRHRNPQIIPSACLVGVGLFDAEGLR